MASQGSTPAASTIPFARKYAHITACFASSGAGVPRDDLRQFRPVFDTHRHHPWFRSVVPARYLYSEAILHIQIGQTLLCVTPIELAALQRMIARAVPNRVPRRSASGMPSAAA